MIFKLLGRQPNDWKDLKEVVVDRKTAEKYGMLTFKDFKEAGKALGEYPPKGDVPKATTDKQATQPPVPLIVAEDKKKTESFLNSLDPAKWKEAETKVSNWSDQMGHSLYDGPKAIIKWPYGELQRYIKESPDGAAVLLFQLVKIVTAAKEAAPKADAAPGNGKTKVINKTA